MTKRLSHVDARGRVRMVDVSSKAPTVREAVARGHVSMHGDTLELLTRDRAPKGNVLAAAHLAAVMAAKRTSEVIPLAHPVPLDAVDVTFDLDPTGPGVRIEVRTRTNARTGVEMEALHAVAAAALTLYDMLKAVDRGMVIGEIALWEKKGGRSGAWKRAEPLDRTKPSAARARGTTRATSRTSARRPARRS
ncbi:MAG: cyclic pyranopterin monophosphate synthase MoaC [Candidatus Eisenbacteria bacterium]